MDYEELLRLQAAGELSSPYDDTANGLMLALIHHGLITEEKVSELAIEVGELTLRLPQSEGDTTVLRANLAVMDLVLIGLLFHSVRDSFIQMVEAESDSTDGAVPD